MLISLILGAALGAAGSFVAARFSKNVSTDALIVVSVMSVYVYISQEPLGLAALMLSAVIMSGVVANARARFVELYLLGLSCALLMATYLFNGSLRALQFPVALSAVVFLTPPIARWIAHKKNIQHHLLSLHGGVFAVLAYPLSLWIAGDFSPHLLWLAIILGVALCLAHVRSVAQWKHIAAITCAVLVGYTLGNFYGIGIVLVSMFAFTSITPDKQQNEETLLGLTLLLLFSAFIYSIAHAGRSILFELGDPYVMAGLLVGAMIPFLLFEIRTIAYTSLLPALIPPLCVILLGKNNGIVVLGGILMGVVLATITRYGRTADQQHAAALQPSVTLLTLVSLLMVPLVFR